MRINCVKGQGKDIPGKRHSPKLWGMKEFGSFQKWRKSQDEQGRKPWDDAKEECQIPLEPRQQPKVILKAFGSPTREEWCNLYF